MYLSTLYLFIILFCLTLLLNLLSLAESSSSRSCPSFDCAGLGTLEFPLSNNQPDCGLFMVNCTTSVTSPLPTIRLAAGGTWYEILDRISPSSYRLRDPSRPVLLNNQSCFSFLNLSLPYTPSASFSFSPSLILFQCFNESQDEIFRNGSFENYDCRDYRVYYRDPTNVTAGEEIIVPHGCLPIELPRNTNQFSSDLFSMLSENFTLEWNISTDCISCHAREGQCSTNNMNEFVCKTLPERSQTTVILASALFGGAFFLICLVIFAFWIHRKRIKNAYFVSRNISSDPSSKSDIEVGSFYYGIPIFCYEELEEATNNFDPCKELGDGGFGTVYHGILKDGREVAIKRLYENNFKRVEQFMNEIKILTCLKHQNLVNLYGCTSRRSRELLLVYEYIQNGTVADHLHGERAKESPLTWDTRMNIAIESASALAYLHKSDIVHRDVKTNNILLDTNFCVKVADFGLSRLFPSDVTHISTAPQGTPGYVDPEYHQCYQLTDKSDVYSFGVVLIELISSMPAVDITRHRHEINLANLAINRIQRCAFDELIDPSLGYKTDAEIMRMTTSVAELAFQCLQMEKDMRPSMDEVLVFLKEVKKGGAGKIPPSPETDEVELLKKKYFQSSPTAVTDVWMSGSTTASSIG